MARALAYITGIKQRIPSQSVMNKQPGMITYKFKSLKRKDLKPQDLIKYLEEKLQIEGRMPNIAEIVTKTVQTVTPRCLAF